MSKAFIDTTILTDALLKPGPLGKAARASLRQYSETELPVYAIKEFKAGPLTNFVWFHNKLVLTQSFSRALEVLQRMSLSPKRYTVATALEALQGAASVNASLTSGELVSKYGEKAKLDSILCDRYRFTIRVAIEKAWRRRRSLTTRVVVPLSCYREVAPFEEDGVLKLEPTRCAVQTECCLAPEMKQHPDELRRLKAAIDAQPLKPENQRRAQALRAMYRTPKRPVSDAMCRNLGDAFFAFFAPPNAVILTTNVRDHAPLAGALGKTVDEPEKL